MLSSVYYKNKEQKERLIKIAFDLNILVKSGPGAGKIGSISGLLGAIADGKVEVTKLNLKDSQTQ